MIGSHIGAVAALLQAAAAPQAHPPTDSVVVESPLPGGVAAVVRFLLNTVPSWIQIGGVILGAIVGAWVLWLLIKHRRALTGWVVSRPRGMQAALAVVAILALAGAASAGTVTWKYTQHSNDFCSGCHVMKTPFQKFGNIENKHAKLSCHDCHQQSLYASARQLYLWVAERPQEIGEHSPVPNAVCENCHVVKGDTAAWQRITSTAGHRVHLESDSSALKDIQCVSCHGVEVHGFSPVNATCGASGCHKTEESEIVLGKMAGQTVRHCTTCHVFKADVPLLATTDSARGTLVPGRGECLGCHEMQKVLKDFDEGKDPHGGKCGTCHNPHKQKTTADARPTCASCHDNWRDNAFHAGESHKKVASKCLDCHQPHSSKVDASNCQGCHEAVRARGARRPPVAFDTSKALRRAEVPPPPRLHGAPIPVFRHSVNSDQRDDDIPIDDGSGEAPLSEGDDSPMEPTSAGGHSRPPPAIEADTFPHARHAKLACLECHETQAGQGRLTFEAPRGCAICHHQAPSQSRCSTCHRPGETAAPTAAAMTVTVPGHQPVARPVPFLHSQHTDRTCVGCHTTPVTLAVPNSRAQCTECHRKHDAPAANCTTCHVVAQPKAAHKTLEAAHQRCDACHTATTVAQLTPTRNFCSTCHAPQAKNHYDAKQCTTCHFLAEPNVYRAKLMTAAR